MSNVWILCGGVVTPYDDVTDHVVSHTHFSCNLSVGDEKGEKRGEEEERGGREGGGGRRVRKISKDSFTNLSLCPVLIQTCKTREVLFGQCSC